MSPAKKTLAFGQREKGSLAGSLDALAGIGRQKSGPVLVVTEYPTELTEEATILVLRRDEIRKILFCDTVAWYEATLTKVTP